MAAQAPPSVPAFRCLLSQRIWAALIHTGSSLYSEGVRRLSEQRSVTSRPSVRETQAKRRLMLCCCVYVREKKRLHLRMYAWRIQTHDCDDSLEVLFLLLPTSIPPTTTTPPPPSLLPLGCQPAFLSNYSIWNNHGRDISESDLLRWRSQPACRYLPPSISLSLSFFLHSHRFFSSCPSSSLSPLSLLFFPSLSHPHARPPVTSFLHYDMSFILAAGLFY